MPFTIGFRLIRRNSRRPMTCVKSTDTAVFGRELMRVADVHLLVARIG